MKTIMLIVHFIGLAMGVGTGIGFIFLGRAAAKMTKEEALKFTMDNMALSRMGTIGLIFLVISGLYLITPYWSTLTHYPFLITKLCLVGLLIIILSIIGYNGSKARKGNPEIYLKRIKRLGPLSLLTSLAIITMAVLTFH